jgi:uncharacterized protein (TIGR03435 family)
MTGSFVVSILTAVTVVMAAALGATSVSRRRRAATRHALLVAAFTIALALPAASALAPYLTIRVSVPAPQVVANAVAVFDDIPQMPLDVVAPVANRAPAAPRTASVSLATAIETIWLLGFIACLVPVVVGLFQVRSLRGLGLPWQRGRALADALAGSLNLRRPVGIVLHESVSGPMTFGTWRPTIVMPIDAETWTDEELTRAIVHELEHIRRADWLTQCAARTLCAAYWFHPLVWIARRQLVLEAERASDDAVLRYAEAAAYADQLVDLARRLSAGHQPLLAMANRRDLAARVHALLDGQQSRGRAGAWLIAALACAAAALVMALSPIRVVARAPRLQAADEHARFDVVSVRPCDPNAPVPIPPRGTGRSASSGLASPGHFRLDCSNVIDLIASAYVVAADGRFTAPSERPSFDRWHVSPDWLRSERFTIEATTSDTTPLSIMQGPMLQHVLEDRFKLKVHRETREIPVLDLVVAKGGAKLTPFVPGTCVPYDHSTYPQPPLEPGEHRCLASTVKGSDGNWVETVEGMTLDDWVRAFDDNAFIHGEPPMVNRTGLTGLQTFRREYSGRSEDRAAELKSQLGLDLRPGRAPREFLVLDHVERPVLDDERAPEVPSARATAPSVATPLRQTFDVVSVRPCNPKAPPSSGGRSMSGARASLGHFRLDCTPVNNVIWTAYLYSRSPSARPIFDQDHQGPEWIRSEKYTIEATAGDATPMQVMRGPMLQAVLEDRFKLKMHRETREVPVLELVVAKGGAKLTPFVPGACVPYDYGLSPTPLEPGQRRCVSHFDFSTHNTWSETVEASTLDDWVRHFDDQATGLGEPPIVNRTGITGLQTFHWENSGRWEDYPAELKAQLGLDLRPGRASLEFLILDHIERPVLDDVADAPARATAPGR